MVTHCLAKHVLVSLEDKVWADCCPSFIRWAITSKVASHDCEKRRSADRQQRRGDISSARINERSCHPVVPPNSIPGRKLFIGTVGRDMILKKDGEGEDTRKIVSMLVDGLKSDEGWLNRSAVGVLKTFSMSTK
ncbi:hypothetical protein QYF36_011547 [Acer negundo]|nr:hypothetical protein QYF36_011547 [Acer negundo]